MALANLRRVYGASYTNFLVSIKDASGQPARIYGSTQSLISDNGQSVLSYGGILDVYLDDSKPWSVTVRDPSTGLEAITDFGLNSGVSSTASTPFVSGLVTGVASVASSNTTIIQTALNSAGFVQIDAQGVVYINAELVLYSNTIFYIPTGCTLKWVNSAGRCTILRNANMIAGDSNISVTGGGTLDGNYLNIGATVSDVRLMGTRFTNVIGLTLDGVRILNMVKYGVHITACSNFRVSNIQFDCPNVGADGVHVHGPSSDGLIENISGTTGDDVVVLNVRDVTQWLDPNTGGVGDITRVTLRNISGNTFSANAGNCVALYGNSTGVTTPITAASWTNGVATVACGTFNPGVNKFITVTNVVSSGANGYNGSFRVIASSAGSVSYLMDNNPGTYTSGGTIDRNYELSGIVVEGVKPVMTNGGNLVHLSLSPTGGTVGAIADVIISKVRGTGVFGRTLYIGAPIGSIIVDGMRHTNVSGSGSEFVYVESSLFIESMKLVDILNEQFYSASLGALIKINSPVRNLQLINAELQVTGGTTSAILFTGATSSTPFGRLGINNLTVRGKPGSSGNAALEIGSGAFNSITIAGLIVSDLVSGVKTNGGTGNMNLSIGEVQATNITAGSAFIVLNGSGAITQITLNGITPLGGGGWYVLDSLGASSPVTVLKAVNAPMYSLGVNWIKTYTGTIFVDGAHIKCDGAQVSLDSGSMFYNTNAAYATGVGMYAYGASSATRIAA